MPIKKKLVLAFSPLILLAILAVGAVGFLVARKELAHAAIVHLESIADLKRDKIEYIFARLKGNLHILQHDPDVRHGLPVLVQYSQTGRDPAGVVTATKNLDALFHVFSSEKDEYLDFMLLGPDGTVVYASNDVHKRLDVGHVLPGINSSTFEGGKTGVTLSPIFRPPSGAFGYQFGMLAAAPVLDDGGRLTGELVVEINMDPLYKSIQDTTGLGATGETLLVKDEGAYAQFLNPLRHDPDAALQRKVYYGDANAIPAQRAARGEDGSGEVRDYRGKEVVTAWRFIPAMGWGLVAKMDASEVFASIRNARNLMLAIALVIFVAMGVVAARVAGSITKPLRDLHRGTEVIAGGDFDHKVGTDVQDEVGQLSRAFDQMTDFLKKSTTSVDHLNREILRREIAEEKAKEAMAIREEFTAMVSHELRTPLTVVEQGVSLILDGAAGAINDQQRTLLNMAKENSDRLVRLVTNVLNFKKMESGNMDPDVRDNNINEIVQGVATGMTALAQEKGLALTVRLDEHLPMTACDRDQITEVLVNLAGNAIKFTEKGGVSIVTRQDGDAVHVMVQDTGPGIAEENIPKLFQPFGQIRMAGAKKTGTGLGLAISRKIILCHGGRIWAESECGKGTTMHFTLPLKRQRCPGEMGDAG